MASEGGRSVGASGADGGVGVAEEAEEGRGEDLGEVRGEVMAVGGSEGGDKAEGVDADRGLVGRVNEEEAREEGGEGASDEI